MKNGCKGDMMHFTSWKPTFTPFFPSDISFHIFTTLELTTPHFNFRQFSKVRFELYN